VQKALLRERYPDDDPFTVLLDSDLKRPDESNPNTEFASTSKYDSEAAVVTVVTVATAPLQVSDEETPSGPPAAPAAGSAGSTSGDAGFGGTDGALSHRKERTLAQQIKKKLLKQKKSPRRKRNAKPAARGGRSS